MVQKKAKKIKAVIEWQEHIGDRLGQEFTKKGSHPREESPNKVKEYREKEDYYSPLDSKRPCPVWLTALPAQTKN